MQMKPSQRAGTPLAKSKIKDLSRQSGNRTLLYWHGGVVKRYEQQLARTAEPYKMELYVIRLFDGAIAESNEVEPEGGQILVERNLEQINALCPETK